MPVYCMTRISLCASANPKFCFLCILCIPKNDFVYPECIPNRPLLKVGPTLPPGGGGSVACGWVGYFGFGQFGPKCLLPPPRGGGGVGSGWVGGWVRNLDGLDTATG